MEMTASRWERLLTHRDWLWLIALLIVAALLRLPGLATAPPGFQFDETYNAWDALRVIEGARPLFLPANAGREVLYTYWQVLFVALLGPTPAALRLASALPGIATVLLLYGLVRLLFPHEGSGLAGLAALCLALSHWHLHFSRYGIRSILNPLWALLTFGVLWLGLCRRDMGWFALCGFGLAAMVWTHPVGRLMPIVVVLVLFHAAWANRQHAGRYLLGLLVLSLVTLFLCLPLGYYFWQHPDQFVGHSSDVSVFHPRVHQGDLLRALVLNVLRVAGMFTFAGDQEWLHNLPGRPIFDPLLGISFLAGLVIFAQWSRRALSMEYRCRHPLHGSQCLLLGVWLIVPLLSSVLSDMAPNFSRTLGAAPVAMLLAAWGLREGWQRLGKWRYPRLAMPLLVVVMTISGGWSAWDYFVRFARHPLAYYHYDQDKIDAAAFLHRESARNTIYLAPLWAQHPTVSLLTRDIDLRSMDTRAALTFPATDEEKGVLYAFPPEQGQNAAALERDWGTWGHRDAVHDRQGRVLLHLFRFPAFHRPSMGEGRAFIADARFPLGPLKGSPVQFGSSIRLLGYQVASGPNVDRELEATLVWEALGQMERDYTAFIHLRDEHGQLWGQVDNWPGHGSYPTSRWHPGDVIVDRYQLEVDPCFPPGRHRLTAGWYDLTTGERLPVQGGGLAVRLGTVDMVSVLDVDRTELSPSGLADYWPSDSVHLFGFDLSQTTLEVGRPLLLTLYWEVTSKILDPVTVLLQLRNSGDHTVTSVEIGGRVESPWGPGQAHCQTLRLRLESVPEGSYQFSLRTAGEPERVVDVVAVQVVPSTRRYTVPPMAFLAGEDLGDAIRLLGYDLPGTSTRPDGSVAVAAGDILPIILYWRMLHPVETSYAVFTHLLDETGQLRGQKDNIPVGGTYPTTEWVAGEVVEDIYQITVPSDVPVGKYRIEVGLYDATTGQRLPLTSEGEETGEDRILLPVMVSVLGEEHQSATSPPSS